MSIVRSVKRRPVGGMPSNGWVWVAEKVMRATTRSPAMIRSSTRVWTSGMRPKIPRKFSIWAASPLGLRPEFWM